MPVGFNNWELQRTEEMIRFHVQAANYQLQQAYYAFAIALIANRTLVMPRVRTRACYGAWSAGCCSYALYSIRYVWTSDPVRWHAQACTSITQDGGSGDSGIPLFSSCNCSSSATALRTGTKLSRAASTTKPPPRFPSPAR